MIQKSNMHKKKCNHHKRHSVSEDMNIKVKGLLKGLRYISHVFGEEEEKNETMRIGFPTDVKHVAHIGPDSSAADTPSWMKEFQDANGGTQTQTFMAFASKPQALSSNEESIGSTSRQTIKTKSKESRQPRRRKDGKPVRQRNGATSTRAHSDEPNRPKKTRKRRVKKKEDGSTLRSAGKPSAIPPSAPSTDESGCNVDQSLYLSAHESSNDEGSAESYGTVASRWREV